MPVTAHDLIGAWHLESWSLIYEDGRPPEFPLGADAIGLILYTPDGHVSATLMRAGQSKTVPGTTTDKAATYDNGFAYAGRYEVRDGVAYHAIGVSANPAIVGLVTSRRIDLDGDRLTLSGPDFTPGAKRTQQIVWRRVVAKT